MNTPLLLAQSQAPPGTYDGKTLLITCGVCLTVGILAGGWIRDWLSYAAWQAGAWWANLQYQVGKWVVIGLTIAVVTFAAGVWHP